MTNYIFIYLVCLPSLRSGSTLHGPPPPDGDTDKDSGLVFFIHFHIIENVFTLHLFTSDDSDEPTGLVSHLPQRLLKEHAEKRRRKRAPLNRALLEADSDSEEDIEDVVIPVDPFKWSQADTGLVGSRIPPFVKKDISIIDRELLEGLSTPLE